MMMKIDEKMTIPTSGDEEVEIKKQQVMASATDSMTQTADGDHTHTTCNSNACVEIPTWAAE